MNDAPNWRVATMRTSIIGLRRVSSHGIIRTKASAETATTTTMKFEANQSSSRPRSSAISRVPRNVATSTKPTRSKPRRCALKRVRSATAAFDSRNSELISPIATTPTGPLMRKHYCQEKLSAIQPPSVGPTTGATTTAIPNKAKPWPRFSGRKGASKDRLRYRHHAAAAEPLQNAEQ
jgi:hypothetical protein